MGYLDDVLEPAGWKDAYDEAVLELTAEADKFDLIVVRGNSGCLMGAAVAAALGKNLAIVRKPGIDTHSGQLVEGVDLYSSRSYIILDDFVCEGSTVKEIIGVMRGIYGQSQPYGVFQYMSSRVRTEEFTRIFSDVGVNLYQLDNGSYERTQAIRTPEQTA